VLCMDRVKDLSEQLFISGNERVYPEGWVNVR
jgi:hypothetical protein